MRAADRSLDIITFVSEHFRDIIRRRLSELAGLALISLSVLGAIALATWSIQDPSLSHATQKPIHNLLGFPGAIFADLAMQLLGLASILLLVPEILLGWRLISHKPVGEKWRGMLWIVATSDRTRRRCRRCGVARACMDFRLTSRRLHAFHPVHRLWPGNGSDIGA